MLPAIVRQPIKPTDQPPLLVLLHGYGSNEQDLIGLSEELDSRLLVVSLRAPLECDFGGYAWFEIQWGPDGISVDGKQALISRDIVIDVLKMLPDALQVRPSKVFLGGFSQGAIMSLGVAASHPELVDGVLMLSGRLLPEFTSNQLSDRFKTVPFLVQHGTMDQVLAITGAREVKAFLEGEGVSVEYHEYPMAHEISRESLDDMATWLFEQIGDSAS